MGFCGFAEGKPSPWSALRCHTPPSAGRPPIFDSLAAETKELLWIDQSNQRFYAYNHFGQQGLNVRAILDEDGNETGDFETPAGGRRYRAIARLVEAGRFPADGLVPCVVKKADAKTSAIDDSLAENTFRLALHPLDQFQAFKRMVEVGRPANERMARAMSAGR